MSLTFRLEDSGMPALPSDAGHLANIGQDPLEPLDLDELARLLKRGNPLHLSHDAAIVTYISQRELPIHTRGHGQDARIEAFRARTSAP